MSKFHLNLKVSKRDVLKHSIIIVLAVGAVILFNTFFPEQYIPKDFIFRTMVYMLIYILIALVVESIFRKFPPKGK
ncbi:MAG: hypothetical protein MJZ66_10090 [Bacteroidales bacterium]|nr:hypothetical protein [Bacteroidales bacterium]